MSELGLWFKARCDMRARTECNALSVSDVGLYWLLMEFVKTTIGSPSGVLQGGMIPLRQVQIIAAGGKLKQWRPSLQRLADAGLLTLTDDGVELNWEGQETTRDIAIRRARNANGTHDVKALHDQGIHDYCRIRGQEDDCPHATVEAGKRPGNKRGLSATSESDQESDQRQRIEVNGSGMTERTTERTTSSRRGSRSGRSPSVVVSGGKEWEL